MGSTAVIKQAGRRLVIGIAGASGSGKTTLSRNLLAQLGESRVLLLHHDHYYRDRSDLHPEQRIQINYDHPDALETPLLIEHLHTLLEGQRVEVPVYNFDRHTRESIGLTRTSRDVIIVEGILTFSDPTLRAMFDILIYVESDDDVCFIRRARRDMAERGRSFDAIARQYLESVKPMFQQFVLPGKKYADVVICKEDHSVAIDLIVAAINRRV